MTGHPSNLRVGRIPYANLLPIFHGLEGGGAPDGVTFVDGHPSELNRKLRDGELDLSPSSSIEYAVRPDRYLLCPGISLSSRRRVMSVLLLSNVPLRELPPDPIAVTGNSDTSITLLEILLRESLGRGNLLLRTELPPKAALRRYPAHLVIGDEAIRAAVDGVAPHVTDLGEWWWRETGKPFVFALWIAARSAWDERRDPLSRLAAALLTAKRFAQASIRRREYPWGGPDWIPPGFRDAYWRSLSYDLEEEAEGLSLFYRLAAKIGRIPAAPPLRFLEIGGGSAVVKCGITPGGDAMIDKGMKIEDVLRRYPQTIPVFERFGIDCAQCQLSEFENIEHGAKVHRIDLAELLKGLNESLAVKG
ncbi:MAG: futalosine synthase [Armatimonadetes bacterium CSP1-3]|nr:MAG: futalosine synthase [Armatimonadetes bacterium CSP1-3]